MRRTAVAVISTLLLSSVGVGIAHPAEAATPHCWGAVKGWTTAGWANIPSKSGRDSSRSCILAYGDRTVGVIALQNSLNHCYGAGLTVDGIYGSRTRAAVRNAQSRSGATVDGIYGPQTMSRMSHWARDANRCGRT